MSATTQPPQALNEFLGRINYLREELTYSRLVTAGRVGGSRRGYRAFHAALQSRPISTKPGQGYLLYRDFEVTSRTPIQLLSTGLHLPSRREQSASDDTLVSILEAPRVRHNGELN